MRRKMQRGGNLGVLTPVFLLFAALFANNPTFMKVLTVGQTLLGGGDSQGGDDGDSQGGDNNRLNQIGGGEQFNKALEGLRGTIEADTTLDNDRRRKLIDCVGTLRSNGGISDAEIAQMASNESQVGGMFGKAAAALRGRFADSDFGKSAAAAAAAAQENAAALRGRFADSDFGKSAAATAASVQTAMGELKDNRMAKFMDNIRSQFENIKDKIVAKVSMNDPNKQECMKSILSYGVDLIKNKISSGISMENITKAMALEAALAKEKGADMLTAAKEKGTDMLTAAKVKSADMLTAAKGKSADMLTAAKKKGAGFFDKITGSSSPSSTPTPLPVNDEEKKAALIAANIEANKSYNAAVEVRNAAKSKVTYNNKNGIQNQATVDELDQAQTATSTAYEVALNAAKAAEAAGVPNVTFPKV